MSNSVRLTKLSTLLTVAVVAGLITFALVRIWYGDIPPLKWYTPATVALIAAGEAVVAVALKRRIDRRDGTEPPDPLSVARALGYAKASAIVGALLAGAWCGVLAYTAGRLGYLAAAQDDTTVAAFAAVCALGLAASGLYLERCCRAPRGGPDNNDSS